MARKETGKHRVARMAPPVKPLAVAETTAAIVLDMSVSVFRRLVQAGALPSPVKVGNLDRWLLKDIEATLTGAAPSSASQDFEI